MRDITLRWFIEDEFVYTDTLNDYDFDCFINIENGEICLFCEAGDDDDFTGIRYEKADNKTREQFTGMTDINNNKIYEKDILDDRSGSVWLVSFFEGKFVAHSPNNIYNFVNLDDYLFEIVGNIHQTPKLLEK